MFDVDPVGLLTREVLRERIAALVAEACAWSVGLSDRPHLSRRHGRVVPTGVTIGVRAAGGQQLGDDGDGRLELADARPGSFQDALNALAPDGRPHADRFEDDVLTPFVLDTCVRAAERFRVVEPALWGELLDDLGEDGDDLVAVVRASEWEAPLRTEAEHLLLAALADVPLVEVESEGLPLSLVRAAEAVTRDAAPEPAPDPPAHDDELAGVLFLADVALRDAGLELPVPTQQAARLVEVLAAEGIEPQEVLAALPHLPVRAETAEQVAARLADQA